MKSTRFITSHPNIVVCAAERATALCKDPSMRPNILGLLTIADPPPYEAKRPSNQIIDSLVSERISVSIMNFRDLITETDNSAAPKTYADGPQIALRINDSVTTEQAFAYRDTPSKIHAERILKWSRSVAVTKRAENPNARIVIHCTAGRSRSTAAAFIILCDRLGPGKETDAMSELLKACERTPLPNTLLVKYADALLNRNGAMIRVAQEQNDNPQDCEADGGKPVTGTALLAAIRRGEL